MGDLRVAPSQRDAFLDAGRRLRESRRRTGGTRWDLYREGLDDNVFVEEYTLPYWADHQDQNTARATAFDRDVLDRVAATAERVEAPVARFLLAD